MLYEYLLDIPLFFHFHYNSRGCLFSTDIKPKPENAAFSKLDSWQMIVNGSNIASQVRKRKIQNGTDCFTPVCLLILPHNRIKEKIVKIQYKEVPNWLTGGKITQNWLFCGRKNIVLTFILFSHYPLQFFTYCDLQSEFTNSFKVSFHLLMYSCSYVVFFIGRYR